MPFDYDILIAGAGPAGCAAAYDLAKAGKRVLLLDRRNFPRPKACACGLTRKTLAALRYSVDPVIERTCHEIVLQRTQESQASVLESQASPAHPRFSPATPLADKSLEVRVRTRHPICAMAERSRFDAFCLQQTLAAAASGGSAHFRKIETIAGIREVGGEHPTHIELDITTNGLTETLTAPILIGADGSNGQTRRLLFGLSSRSEAEGSVVPPAQPQDPAWYTRGFALEALVPYTALPTPLPAGDAPHDLVFDFSPIPGGYGWLFPKGDHINIGVGAFAPESDTDAGAPHLDSEMWASIEARLKQVTRTLLSTYSLQKLGIADPPHITGQHLGMGGHTYVPQGRVLLTGDAAGLVDPLTGEGIHSAIISGQAAAAAILETASASFVGTGLQPRHQGMERMGDLPPEGVALAYARHLRPLQQTLAFSHRAARSFYRSPARGFRAMRLPILRSLILKTYADGLPHTRLLTSLAKLV